MFYDCCINLFWLGLYTLYWWVLNIIIWCMHVSVSIVRRSCICFCSLGQLDGLIFFFHLNCDSLHTSYIFFVFYGCLLMITMLLFAIQSCNVSNWMASVMLGCWEEEKADVVAPTPFIILTRISIAPKSEGPYIWYQPQQDHSDLLYVSLFSARMRMWQHMWCRRVLERIKPERPR